MRVETVEAMDKPTQEPATELTRLSEVDIEAFAQNLARVIEEGGKALAAYIKPREEGKIKNELAEDVTDVVKTLGQVTEYWLADPQRAVELQASLGRAYLDLWAGAVKRMAGETTAPVGGARPQGQALCRSGMVAEPVLRFPQAGLSAHRAVGRQTGQRRRRRRPAHPAEGGILRQADRQRDFAVEFRAHQSRTAARDVRRRNADNLVRGMHMLTEDIKAGHGNLKIRQSDPSVFEVGRNLALTPGKVIFQNDLIQLIQYEATTKEVLKVPLLIVPPWINKFYILDLTPEKSFIKWCVDQGITVFVVSWVNPGRQARDQELRAVHEGRRDRRARRRRNRHRREEGQRHRLLRRRHAAVDDARLSCRQEAGPRALGDACSPRRSTSPMPAT